MYALVLHMVVLGILESVLNNRFASKKIDVNKCVDVKKFFVVNNVFDVKIVFDVKQNV